MQDHLDYKNSLRKSAPQKLNGGGNFTDYTFARFKKDLAENPNMLVSGFIDGRLVYIFEYPFNIKPFQEKLSSQLVKKFPLGDEANSYLRSASFDYKDYIEDDNLKIVYLATKDILEENKMLFVKDFYQKLITL